MTLEEYLKSDKPCFDANKGQWHGVFVNDPGTNSDLIPCLERLNCYIVIDGEPTFFKNVLRLSFTVNKLSDSEVNKELTKLIENIEKFWRGPILVKNVFYRYHATLLKSGFIPVNHQRKNEQFDNFAKHIGKN